jgi:hypothetical protein
MFDFLKRDQMKKDKIITKIIKLKIDQHEPHKQQKLYISKSDIPILVQSNNIGDLKSKGELGGFPFLRILVHPLLFMGFVLINL